LSLEGCTFKLHWYKLIELQMWLIKPGRLSHLLALRLGFAARRSIVVITTSRSRFSRPGLIAKQPRASFCPVWQSPSAVVIIDASSGLVSIVFRLSLPCVLQSCEHTYLFSHEVPVGSTLSGSLWTKPHWPVVVGGWRCWHSLVAVVGPPVMGFLQFAFCVSPVG